MPQIQENRLESSLSLRIAAGIWGAIYLLLAALAAYELLFGEGKDWLGICLGLVLGTLVVVTIASDRGRSFRPLLPELTVATLVITVLGLLIHTLSSLPELGGSLSWMVGEVWGRMVLCFLLGGYGLIPAAFGLPALVFAGSIRSRSTKRRNAVTRGILWLIVILVDLAAIPVLLALLFFGRRPPPIFWG